MADTKHTFTIKDKGKFIVIYAEETKAMEFDTEEEADEWAKYVKDEL